jgi:SAM-dependent methyltransferase
MTRDTSQLMTDEEFDTFFGPYAENAEKFYEATYWRFADELVKHHIRMLLSVEPGGSVVDAGGGTGRWANWLADEMGVSVRVADKSTAMLAQARQLIARRDDELVSVLHCDLEQPDAIGSEYDGGISTYGVWSFVSDPVVAFRTIFNALKPGAVFIAMAHGYANALESKLSSANTTPEEIAMLRDTGIVKWAEHVPPLRTFSSATFVEAAKAAGFEFLRVYGIGVVVHPGPEDFGYPYISESCISANLRNTKFFQTALETEILMAARPELADRGTNLLIALRKPSLLQAPPSYGEFEAWLNSLTDSCGTRRSPK